MTRLHAFPPWSRPTAPSTEASVHAHTWVRPVWVVAALANASQPLIILTKSMYVWPGYVWAASSALILLGSAARLSAERFFPVHASCVREALGPTRLGLKVVAGVFIALAVVVLVGLAANRNWL